MGFATDSAIPPAAGVGLRAPHVAHVLEARPPVPWFEVHSENYFADGGAALRSLERVREHYPIALHGVGLGLGSCAPLDRAHVAKLSRLVDRIEPGIVSEHLSWGRLGERHYNELLPLPYTHEALDLVAARVGELQEALGRHAARVASAGALRATSRAHASRSVSRCPDRWRGAYRSADERNAGRRGARAGNA